LKNEASLHGVYGQLEKAKESARQKAPKQALPGYVVIEDPIGVGKTTLAKRIAQTFNCGTLLERAEDNPFLPRFYANEHNSALPTQLFFLFQRVKQIADLHQRELFSNAKVSDFLMEKDQLFAQVTLEDEALNLYQQVFEHLTVEAPTPDLVVYLQAPADVLLQRIQRRGIPEEQNIDAQYLQQLNDAYAEFFHFYDSSPLLIVNAADIDWANNKADYQQLLEHMLAVKTGRHYYNPHPSFL